MNRLRSFSRLTMDRRVLGLFSVFAVPALLSELLIPVVDGAGVIVLIVLSSPELLLQTMIWDGALDHWVRLAGEWLLPSYAGGYNVLKYAAFYLFSMGSVVVGDWATRCWHGEVTSTNIASTVAGGFLLVGVFMFFEPFVLEPPNPASMTCGTGWACDTNPWSFLVEWIAGSMSILLGIAVLFSRNLFRRRFVSRGIIGLFVIQVVLLFLSLGGVGDVAGVVGIVPGVINQEAILVNETIEFLLPVGLKSEDWWLGLLAMPVVYYITAVVVAASGRAISRSGRRRLG